MHINDPFCLNSFHALLTYEERKEKKKECDKIYIDTHKEQKREYDKIYNETHKEQVREKKRQYNEKKKKKKATQWYKVYMFMWFSSNNST